MLNQEERNILAGRISNSAVFYGKYDLAKEQISTYISVLENHYKKPLAKYLVAFNDYEKDSKNKFFPNPANLNQYINPEVSDDHQATAAASRAIEAVSKFGWCNSSQAKEYIGEIGWRAVQAFGGWQYVCENLGTEIQLTTFNAQIRELSKSIISRAKLGVVDAPVELPYENKNTNVLELLKNVKSIEG